MQRFLTKKSGKPPPPPKPKGKDAKDGHQERCPRCGYEDPWKQIGQYSVNNRQYGYVTICVQCNYQKSRISSSNKVDPDRDNKEYSYDFAPKDGQYIAPVMPLKSKGSGLW